MNVCLRIACACICLLCNTGLWSQVGFNLPDINNASPGASVLLPVRVSNFDSIVGAQFVIRWDSTVLRFKNVNGFSNLPGLSLLNFNTSNALDSGLIRFQWIADNSFPGTSLPDSTIIFRIRFDVIGPLLSGTSVHFTSAFPTIFEITKVRADSSLVSLDTSQCNLHQGFVAVGYTAATAAPQVDAFHLQISPNPCTESAQVAFDLEKTSDVQMSVIDASGRILKEIDMHQLSSGRHGTEIGRLLIHDKKGIYYLVLRSASQVSVRPFLVH
jgi:hypothetical protein